MKSLVPMPFLNQISPEFHALFSNSHEAVQLQVQFDESTHALWCFSDGDERRFLKLCSTETANSSSFWQATSLLFSLDFSSDMDRYSDVYSQVANWSQFKVPRLLSSSSYKEEGGSRYSGFLLTDYIDGSPLSNADITIEHVQSLAEQLTGLHLVQSSTAGPLFKQTEHFGLTPEQWRIKLKETLFLLANEKTLPRVEEVVDLVNLLEIESFQPIMLDLRWDQFLQLEDQKLALVDLDAFVWGPKALELVMLEYLLDEKQAEIFKAVYCLSHEIPDLTIDREVYRVLLFQMNVLGETDFNKWMKHPSRF